MKIFKLLVLLALPIGLSGQSLSKATTIQLFPMPSKTSVRAAASASPDTVFYEQFNGGLNGWTNSTQKGPAGFEWNNTPPGGQYTNEPLIFSSSSTNGVVQLRADFHNPGAASNFKDITAFLRSPAINTIGYPELFLEFEHYFRPFTDAVLTVAVSADGTTWTEFNVRNNVATNSASANPVIEKIPVGTIIGNQPAAYIRFAWKNESHYFWQIDDVKLVTPPAFDLKMESNYFKTTSDSSSAQHYYTRIPLRQANTDEVTFGANITNNGYLTQNNVRLKATVNGPQLSFNEESGSIIIPPASVNIPIDFSKKYRFLDGVGTYTGTLEVVSDSSDFSPQDNETTFSVLVTDTVYARDDNILANINNRLPNTILCNKFDIHRQDTATSLSAYIYHASNNPSIGSVVKMYLFDETFNVVAQTSDYSVPNSGWHHLKIPRTAITPGVYHVGLEVISGSIWLVVNTNRTPPKGTTWQNTGAQTGTGGIGGTWSDNVATSIPFIRLNVTQYNCNPFVTQINAITTSTCQGNDGSIGLSHLRGTAPFNYLWTSLTPGNSITAGQGTDSAYGLNPGNYRVRITDATGCNESFDVLLSNGGAPILKSASIIEETCYGFNDGSINVTLEGGTAPFNFSWSDGSSGAGLFTLENIGEGTYTVTITDGGPLGCTVVDSFYVPGPEFPIATTRFVTNESCDSCNNGIMTFFVTGGTPPYSYSFSGASGVPPGTINQPNQSLTFNNLVPGPYNLFIVDANGCQHQNSVEIEKYDPTGVAEQSIDGIFNIAPNPARNKLFITQNNFTMPIVWSLIDLTGKEVDVFIQNSIHIEIDIEQIPKGMYFLRGFSNSKVYSERFIKQ